MNQNRWMCLSVMVLLCTADVLAGPMALPVAEPARSNGQAPDHAQVISGDWDLAPRYYVHSEDGAIREGLGASHGFPGGFSARLTQNQVEQFQKQSIKVEPVVLHRLTDPQALSAGGSGIAESAGKQGNMPAQAASTKTCIPESTVPWGVAAVNGGSGGQGVTIAILDSGIDTSHPDIQNVVACQDATKQGIAPGCADLVGHGTHVAGTIGASGGPNGSGITGVAPLASLMVVKVCQGGHCWGDDIAAGIRYAVANGAQVLSMSFGGSAPDPQVSAALDEAREKGVLAVAAAGNNGPDNGMLDFPAYFQGVVAVAAVASDGIVPAWSSRGTNDGDALLEENEIEFCAPGVAVESAGRKGCYATQSGTSMATAHISGLAALLWQGDALQTQALMQFLAQAERSVDWPLEACGFGMPVAP